MVPQVSPKFVFSPSSLKDVFLVPQVCDVNTISLNFEKDLNNVKLSYMALNSVNFNDVATYFEWLDIYLILFNQYNKKNPKFSNHLYDFPDPFDQHIPTTELSPKPCKHQLIRVKWLLKGVFTFVVEKWKWRNRKWKIIFAGRILFS